MMRVEIERSGMIKPSYEFSPRPVTNSYIHLSIFDKTTYDTHVSVVYAFPTLNPPNSVLKLGLQRVLSDYPEWAGRLGRLTDSNEPVIFLNDEGVRFVEAKVDTHTLHQALPNFESTPTLLTLVPSHQAVTELVQVQLTRFSCGSLVVGFSAHHQVGDGQSASNFLVAWGKACRGVDIGPLPTHTRTIFMPRVPPKFEFEHRGVEFTTSKEMVEARSENDDVIKKKKKNVVVQKVHFTLDFIKKLKAKAKASASNPNRNYTTFQCLMAHLWRVITIARGLQPYHNQTTKIKISVNGRTRLKPRVPDEYFGNLVLWAFPKLQVGEVVNKPLSHVADTIRDAVSAIDDNYFRSFIDFATHKMEQENLISTAELSQSTFFPNLDVDSWLRYPFYDVDFGGGSPSIFMPVTVLIEGLIFLMPSFTTDGSVDAFVHLFQHNLPLFNQNCYIL